MPLTLNELYTQTKHQYHLSMIAGKTGDRSYHELGLCLRRQLNS